MFEKFLKGSKNVSPNLLNFLIQESNFLLAHCKDQKTPPLSRERLGEKRLSMRGD